MQPDDDPHKEKIGTVAAAAGRSSEASPASLPTLEPAIQQTQQADYGYSIEPTPDDASMPSAVSPPPATSGGEADVANDTAERVRARLAEIDSKLAVERKCLDGARAMAQQLSGEDGTPLAALLRQTTLELQRRVQYLEAERGRCCAEDTTGRAGIVGAYDGRDAEAPVAAATAAVAATTLTPADGRLAPAAGAAGLLDRVMKRGLAVPGAGGSDGRPTNISDMQILALTRPQEESEDWLPF
ncbi:hypothetical protein HK405_001253, partial [Cladochytrium tenue]